MPRTSLFTAVVICALSVGGGALAQEADSSDFRAIDLDDSGPLERVYTIKGSGVSAPSFSVVIWNDDRGQWIDVLRGSGDGSDLIIGAPVDGALSSITTGDGREWVWESNRYVPLANMSLVEFDTIDIELIADVQRIGGAPAPSNTFVMRYAEPDGTLTQIAVLDSDSSFCGMGGGLCPAVLIRDGEAIENIGVDIGYSFGVSVLLDNEGHRLIEQGRSDGVVLRGVRHGDVVGFIEEQLAAISEYQPPAPEGRE